MKKKSYAMNYDELLRGIEIIGEDLDFLCSLSENPSEEYQIPDAVEYSLAVIALTNQLAYMTQDLATSKLSEDENHVILTKEQVDKMNDLYEEVEEALVRLRKCGISIQIN
jgi:hypothetical protein